VIQVERLVDRVEHSTLLEDRRDACRALKAMSRKYRVEVGAQGMNTLKQVCSCNSKHYYVCYMLNYNNNFVSI
jgi:hypothetical protein